MEFLEALTEQPYFAPLFAELIDEKQPLVLLDPPLLNLKATALPIFTCEPCEF